MRLGHTPLLLRSSSNIVTQFTSKEEIIKHNKAKLRIYTSLTDEITYV